MIYVPEDELQSVALNNGAGEEYINAALEVKRKVEEENTEFDDYNELSDLDKGMRLAWVLERAVNLVNTRHHSLAQRREELIQQELSRGDPIQTVTELPQPPKQEQLVPIRYLFGIGIGALLVGFGIGRRLSEYEIVYKGDQ